MAAPTLRAVVDYGAGTPPTFTEPTGTAEDDILLALLEIDSNDTSGLCVGVPSGWTSLGESDAGIGYGTTYGQAAWIRRGASAPDLAFTALKGVNHVIGTLYAFQGVGPTIENPFEVWTWTSAFGNNVNPVIFPSIESLTDDALIGYTMHARGRFYAAGTGANDLLTAVPWLHYYENNWGTDGAVALAGAAMATAGATGTTGFSSAISNDNFKQQVLIVAAFSLASAAAEAGGGSALGAVLLPYYYNTT